MSKDYIDLEFWVAYDEAGNVGYGDTEAEAIQCLECGNLGTQRQTVVISMSVPQLRPREYRAFQKDDHDD